MQSDASAPAPVAAPSVDTTATTATSGERKPVYIAPILPASGLVYSEKGPATEVLCKPKLLPLKSASLEKLESIEKQMSASLR